MPLVALGLPRLLAPVLPTTYSPRYLLSAKAYTVYKHSEFPYHTCVHCKGFAPAAPRRARACVSVPFSGLLLSKPLWIFGLVSRYLTNSLIHRRPILKHCFWENNRSRNVFLSGLILSFPRLSQTQGQVVDVLLSSLPVSCDPRLAWLNRTQIAAISRRINGYFFSRT